MSYAEAKALADRDEASLGSGAQGLIDAQAKVLGPMLGNCVAASKTRDLSPFVVVMRLDSAGRVTETWRQGSSDIAACFERGARGSALFPPPAAPFFTSFDMHFDN